MDCFHNPVYRGFSSFIPQQDTPLYTLCHIEWTPIAQKPEWPFWLWALWVTLFCEIYTRGCRPVLHNTHACPQDDRMYFGLFFYMLTLSKKIYSRSHQITSPVIWIFSVCACVCICMRMCVCVRVCVCACMGACVCVHLTLPFSLHHLSFDRSPHPRKTRIRKICAFRTTLDVA